jgi:hypothetical protein
MNMRGSGVQRNPGGEQSQSSSKRRRIAANQVESAASGVMLIPDLPGLLDRTELNLLDENKLNLELRDTLSMDKAEVKVFRLQFTENEDGPPRGSAWRVIGEAMLCWTALQTRI